jgi:hypothetical protein
LIPQRFWDLFCLVANRHIYYIPFFARIWAIAFLGDKQYQKFHWYTPYSPEATADMLSLAFLIVANDNRVDKLSTPVESDILNRLTTIEEKVLQAAPKYRMAIKDAMGQDTNFNCVPALLVYLNTGINVPFCDNGSVEGDKAVLGYERYRKLYGGKYSFYEVKDWLSVDHLVSRVKNPKFKYPFPYCLGSENLFLPFVAKAALCLDVMSNTSEHTFMSDVYNLVAAPNPIYMDKKTDTDYTYFNKYIDDSARKITFGASWYSRLPYNMARRLYLIVYNNNDDVPTIGYWDDLPEVKSMPRTLTKQYNINYNVPNQVDKYYVSRWDAMCPEYEVYLRHNFEHHAFREIVLYCFAYGCYFLVDAFPHDDNYVAMSDTDANLIRDFIKDTAQQTNYYIYNALKFYSESHIMRSKYMNILDTLYGSPDDCIAAYRNACKNCTDLLNGLVKKCSSPVEAFGVYMVLVKLANERIWQISDETNIIARAAELVNSAYINSSNLEYELISLCLDVLTANWSITLAKRSNEPDISAEDIARITEKLKPVFKHYYNDNTMDADFAKWEADTSLRDGSISANAEYKDYKLASKIYFVANSNHMGYWSVPYVFMDKDVRKDTRYSESNFYRQVMLTTMTIIQRTKTTKNEAITMMTVSNSTSLAYKFVFNYSAPLLFKLSDMPAVLQQAFDILRTQSGTWDAVVNALTSAYNLANISSADPWGKSLHANELKCMFAKLYTEYNGMLEELDAYALPKLPKSLHADYYNIITNFVKLLDENKSNAVLIQTPAFNGHEHETDEFYYRNPNNLKQCWLDFMLPVVSPKSNPQVSEIINSLTTIKYEYILPSELVNGFDPKNQTHFGGWDVSEGTLCIPLSHLLEVIRRHIGPLLEQLSRITADEPIICDTFDEFVDNSDLSHLSYTGDYAAMYLFWLLKHCFEHYIDGAHHYDELCRNSAFLFDFK